MADFDDDGDEDLFVTHLRNETSTLYVNDGHGSFSDETILTGLGQASRAHTGFGTSFLDFDNDGRLDLISFNGAVTAIEALVEAGDPYPYHEQNQLFRNEGGGRFTDVSHLAGETFANSEISRGAAFGDVDNDGDTDVLVMQVNGPARLLINNVGNLGHWIGLSVLGDARHAAAGHARRGAPRGPTAALAPRAHRRQLRFVQRPTHSGRARRFCRTTRGLRPVAGGATEVWDAIEPDRWTTLEEGGGRPAAADLAATRLASVAITGRAFPPPQSAEATLDDAEPPPELELPPLERFEIAVREQLGRTHAALRDLLTKQDPDPTSLADAYGELGLQLQAYDLRQSAVNSYRHAETLSPEDYRWAHLLGSVLQSVGDADRARKRFRRVVTLEPRYAPAWVYLGQLELEQNRRADARDAFDRAMAIEPDCAPCRVGLGRVALLDEDYERALGLFQEALELSPTSNNIHYHLAMTLRGLGKLDEAKRQLEQRGPVKAGIADPLLAEVPARLRGSRALQDEGVALARSGRLEEAIERFREALELEPADSMTRFYVGLAQAKLGRLDAARDAFLEAIRLEPRSERAQLFLGSVLALQGNDPGAAEAFAAALEIHPGLTAARNERAKALQRLGRYAAALDEFEEVLRGDPGNPEARLYRAFALIRLGRYAEAAGNAEKDREALPEQPAFAHIQARLLAAAPDRESATANRPCGWPMTCGRRCATSSLPKRWPWRWPSWDASTRPSSGRTRRTSVLGSWAPRTAPSGWRATSHATGGASRVASRGGMTIRSSFLHATGSNRRCRFGTRACNARPRMSETRNRTCLTAIVCCAAVVAPLVSRAAPAGNADRELVETMQTAETALGDGRLPTPSGFTAAFPATTPDSRRRGAAWHARWPPRGAPARRWSFCSRSARACCTPATPKRAGVPLRSGRGSTPLGRGPRRPRSCTAARTGQLRGARAPAAGTVSR